jgi:predicted porin
MALAASTAAYAADLPTRKAAPPAPAKPSCFSDLLHYFDSSPVDCPLSYWGLTFYATVDMGVGYEAHGTPFNGNIATGVEELVQKNSNRSLFLATPGGLSQSQVGVKAKEPLGYGWSFVGEVATGFDPYSLMLSNGPASLAQNTQTPLNLQSSNADSSRAGQWYNSVGYGGFSNDTYGTLTAGRQNSLTLDGVNAYDPMGGSYAFSPIGWSGKVPGDGSTEDARINTSVKYNIKYANLHANAIGQFGGYSYGNGSNGEWQVNVGGDFFNNALSVDAIYSHIKDQVNLGTFNGPVPPTAPSNALKATISNNDGLMLLAKYKWNQFTVYGGFEYIRYTNPSDKFATASASSPAGGAVDFTSLGGFPVVAGGVSVTAYNNPLNFDVLWTGVKYAVNDRVDVTGAYYLYIQNNYTSPGTNCGPNTKPAVAGFAPQGSANAACQGYLNAFSAMVDWRPLKRVDVYAGLMYSRVSGGLATGYLYNYNVDPTVGIRVRF